MHDSCEKYESYGICYLFSFMQYSDLKENVSCFIYIQLLDTSIHFIRSYTYINLQIPDTKHFSPNV